MLYHYTIRYTFFQQIKAHPLQGREGMIYYFMMKKICVYLCILTILTGLLFSFPLVSTADTESGQADESSVGKYGMLPIYGRDVEDGIYDIEVEVSSPLIQISEARLKVSGGKMEADLMLQGGDISRLFLGTAEEAGKSSSSDDISGVKGEDGAYTYTVPVEALDKAIFCAVLLKGEESWREQVILFDATSLPEDALLLDLPDYDAIEAAMKSQTAAAETEENTSEKVDLESQEPVEPMDIDMEDGEYSIEVALVGGSGKATVSSPTILIVKDGKAYAKLVWSSSNYDYMIVGNRKYINTSLDGGNSTFKIPIAVMDSEMPVIADTTAMGTPHEISYRLTFYSESIDSKSQLPQEAAKKVVVVAFIIIVGGGILNHFVNKKRKC